MDLHQLNEHVANIGEDLSVIARLIKEQINDNLNEMKHTGQYSRGETIPGGQTSMPGYTIDRFGHTSMITVYAEQSVRDRILHFLNRPLLPTTGELDELLKLYHARCHNDYMNDGRTMQPPTAREVALRRAIGDALSPGTAPEPRWAAQEPETVQGDFGGCCVAELPTLHKYIVDYNIGREQCYVYAADENDAVKVIARLYANMTPKPKVLGVVP